MMVMRDRLSLVHRRSRLELSQIATVTLSATKDAFGVTLGAILGHSMCTGIAVIGGKFLATRISERTVAIVGGALFLLFALHSFATGPAA